MALPGVAPLNMPHRPVPVLRGYCFHTQKGIQAFGNAGCKYDDAGKVPVNVAERYNVNAIKKAEAKGC
jgi:YARHG domain-containing protein